jgi:PilZ domain
MTPLPIAPESSPAEESRRLDRRADVRCLCDRGAGVRLGDGLKTWALGAVEASVRNLSTRGVGLLLNRELPVGALVFVEPAGLGKGRPVLLARVRFVSPQEGGWHHGCELGEPLSEGALQDWLA